MTWFQRRAPVLRYNASLDYFETLEEPNELKTLPPNELLVALIRARGLNHSVRGYSGQAAADPFTKLRVNDEERQSKVVQRTLEPQWSERYRIPAADTAGVALKIRVFDWNLGSACESLGHARVALHQFSDRQAHRRWFTLSFDGAEDYSGGSSCGEIELALRWIHNPDLAFFDYRGARDGNDGFPGMRPNCLRIAVIRAKNLCATDFSGSSNPYTALSVLLRDRVTGGSVESSDKKHRLNHQGTQKVETRRADSNKSSDLCYRSSHAVTRIEQSTLDPRWDEVLALPCMQIEGDESEGSMQAKSSKLCIEIEDHTYVGVLGMLGATTIDLSSLIDRRRRRFWVPLLASCKATDGKPIAHSRGKLELALQYFRCLDHVL